MLYRVCVPDFGLIDHLSLSLPKLIGMKYFPQHQISYYRIDTIVIGSIQYSICPNTKSIIVMWREEEEEEEEELQTPLIYVLISPS